MPPYQPYDYPFVTVFIALCRDLFPDGRFTDSEAEAFFHSHVDETPQYQDKWESVGITYYHGVLMYMFTFTELMTLPKYQSDVFVLQNYHNFKPKIRAIEERIGFTQSELDAFRLLVRSNTLQWIENEGEMSCEFSTTEKNLEIKAEHLNQIAFPNGKWVMVRCKICEENCPTHPYHVQIIPTAWDHLGSKAWQYDAAELQRNLAAVL